MLMRKIWMIDSGSSPRVRGSHIQVTYGFKPGGIIPAGAGLTFLPRNIASPFRDHPRGCGAHKALKYGDHFFKGSSPRVRGSPLGQFYGLT